MPEQRCSSEETLARQGGRVFLVGVITGRSHVGRPEAGRDWGGRGERRQAQEMSAEMTVPQLRACGQGPLLWAMAVAGS